jgi:hypothetical protein
MSHLTNKNTRNKTNKPKLMYVQKRRMTSAKPKLRTNKFVRDKFVKIGLQNPPEIEKTQ